MPLYEYECEACRQRFELIRKFSDSAVEVCTLCGKGPVTRLFSSPAIQFKGSGFYITDYARKGEGGKGEGSKGEAGKTESTSGTTKSDGASASTGTKTETKSNSAAKADSATASTSAKASGPAKD